MGRHKPEMKRHHRRRMRRQKDKLKIAMKSKGKV